MLWLRIKMVGAERSMLCHDRSIGLRDERGFFARFGPRPGVTKPELWQHMDGRQVQSPVIEGDLYQDIIWSRFEVLNKDVPVPIVIQNASINQLVLVVLKSALVVLLNKLCIRVFVLWIFVQHPEIRMR